MKKTTKILVVMTVVIGITAMIPVAGHCTNAAAAAYNYCMGLYPEVTRANQRIMCDIIQQALDKTKTELKTKCVNLCSFQFNPDQTAVNRCTSLCGELYGF